MDRSLNRTPSTLLTLLLDPRAGNYAVGEMTPILQETIEWRLYPMHAGFCVLSFILVYFAYPETMGVPLEEMDELFGDQPAPSHPPSDEHAPLRRSHSLPSFHRGQPHSHAPEVEPPAVAKRHHQRTLSGSASLPGRGSEGVEAVRGWWAGTGTGVGGSRPTTPNPAGGARGYRAVEQTDDERL
ncbi:hypothetical protein JCM3770_004701 [Rhodotorula araucariae]